MRALAFVYKELFPKNYIYVLRTQQSLSHSSKKHYNNFKFTFRGGLTTLNQEPKSQVDLGKKFLNSSLAHKTIDYTKITRFTSTKSTSK